MLKIARCSTIAIIRHKLTTHGMFSYLMMVSMKTKCGFCSFSFCTLTSSSLWSSSLSIFSKRLVVFKRPRSKRKSRRCKRISHTRREHTWASRWDTECAACKVIRDGNTLDTHHYLMAFQICFFSRKLSVALCWYTKFCNLHKGVCNVLLRNKIMIIIQSFLCKQPQNSQLYLEQNL